MNSEANNGPVVPENDSTPIVNIEKWVYGGAGLARHDGKVVMVPYTLPGERVAIERTAHHSSFDEARVTNVVEASAERVAPRCPHFTKCGGCQYQHASPEFQAKQKAEIVREVFARVGKIEVPAEIDILAGEAWNYRNRVQFHSDGRNFGFLEAASHKVVDVEECPLLAPELNAAFAHLRHMHRDRGGWPDFVRSIELFSNGEETLVNVLETQGGKGVAKGFFEWVEKRVAGASLGALTYKTKSATFRVSHGAFFQVNRFLVEALVERALASVAGDEVIDATALDLYAGVGLFSLPLAKRFSRVTAVESNRQAARDLEFNAAQVGVKVDVRAMQTEQYLEQRKTTAAFVLADPPRSGLGTKTVKHLLRIKPAKMTIVSCDPATLARDAAALGAGGYALTSLAIADLFPQTMHVESVASFELR